MARRQRPGDNLYTASVIALDVDTGKLRGHHQYHWNESWDWDEVSAPLLIDVQRNGRTITGLVHPARNGYLWLLERQADAISFVDAKPFVKQDVFTAIDPETGRPEYDESKKPATGKKITFCPSHWGGKDWPPAAYNPKTGSSTSRPTRTSAARSWATEKPYEPGQALPRHRDRGHRDGRRGRRRSTSASCRPGTWTPARRCGPRSSHTTGGRC